MKTSNRFFAVIILLFFSIYFISCSQESDITSPNENTLKVISKTTDLPHSVVDYSKDTVITFSKSGKRLIVSKKLSANQLSQMDDYLATHSLSTKTSSVSPQLQNCSDVVEYSWSLLQKYSLLPGHHMGIWLSTDVISYSQAYNQYGFNEVCINYDEAIAVNQAGFKNSDSIMVRVSSSTSPSYILSNQAYGYYLIDEPLEHGVSYNTMTSLANAIHSRNSAAKFMFTDWYWPIGDLPCWDAGDYLAAQQYMSNVNTYIMCDQYNNSDCNGDMEQFWNKYRTWYGSTYSWMNFAQNTGLNAGNWPYCFDWMNVNSLTNVWLYASDDGNEGVVQEWCQNAWIKFWLEELDQQVATEWTCSQNSCTSCSYPDQGNWTIKNMWYTSTAVWVENGQEH